MVRNCLRPQCWLEGVSNAPRILADGHRHDSSTQSLRTQRFYTTKAKINTELEGGVVRALTWRWLFRIQRGGARLQGQFEARARQSQLTQQDPHAAEHIALTARTHSQSVASRGDRERAHGSTRWRTFGAILRPPPLRLVAISRRLTSRPRRHDDDVTNGTSHRPPASSSPPARTCANGIASTEWSFRSPASPPASFHRSITFFTVNWHFSCGVCLYFYNVWIIIIQIKRNIISLLFHFTYPT